MSESLSYHPTLSGEIHENGKTLSDIHKSVPCRQRMYETICFEILFKTRFESVYRTIATFET